MAARLAGERRDAIAVRSRAARKILGRHAGGSDERSPHLWIPLPRAVDERELRRRGSRPRRRRGDGHAVRDDEGGAERIRISIGAPSSVRRARIGACACWSRCAKGKKSVPAAAAAVYVMPSGHTAQLLEVSGRTSSAHVPEADDSGASRRPCGRDVRSPLFLQMTRRMNATRHDRPNALRRRHDPPRPSQDAYWSLGIARERVEQAIANSLCFAVFDDAGRQAGFARGSPTTSRSPTSPTSSSCRRTAAADCRSC